MISQLLQFGLQHQKAGRLEKAEQAYRQILKIDRQQAGVHYNLGLVLKDLDRLGEAVACYRCAIELKPDFAEAFNNLGNALREQGKLEEAANCFLHALELKPKLAAAHSNLGVVLKEQGILEGALACFRRALELEPGLTAVHSNLLYTLHYCPGATLAQLAAAHAEYDRRHAAPLRGAMAACPIVKDHQRPLRLGFVSADLGQHPVSYFLVRVLENLAPADFATICYSDRISHDAWTHRLRAATTEWRDVAAMDDQQLAERIRADRIDILFDLAGHAARNRMLVFARKPAPVQITWIGYEGTTGLTAMDYLLADRHLIPSGSEGYYQERVLRMPDGFMCYDPPAAAPAVVPPPSLERGYTTFGSFNNPAKITADVAAVWAKILSRAPASRLVLKYSGLDDQPLRRRFLERFSAHGIGEERLDLLPASAYAEYVAAYGAVDVVLDPFPFSGSATTCEALWMGVPVVTCPGEIFASRHSLSHLWSVGLTETIARNLDEYVELALSLAGDSARLRRLRASLREQMANSPLCDGKRFTKNLASLLRGVWRRREDGHSC